MPVADFLRDIGEGVKTGAKAVGSVAQPIAERTAQVISGEAPKIDDEQRQRTEALEDAQLNVKSQQLEEQLAMGQKYGTLTPEQQQQYVDQIAGLYSHPRHAGKLMEKLRQAVHPNGAVAQGPQAPLANATPPFGTAAADDQLKVAQEQRKAAEVAALAEEKARIAAKYHKTAGKSPPLPGNQLPPDAIGADGQPISPDARDAQHSFVEWNGSWWPVAKPKPVMKTIGGRMVLIDPQTGAKLRDLGAAGQVKVTTRQTLQPGDDGQMHLVNLTSVSGPGGEKIEVDPQQSETEQPEKGETPKTPVKKVNPGSILPKTGAQPVSAPQGTGASGSGKTVPGLSNLANKKTQSVADQNELETDKKLISSIDQLLPILEKRKGQGGLFDAVKQRFEFEKYKHGIPPSDPELTAMFENSALLGVAGASVWSRIGRSRYTFEVIKQHLPQPTDTPELMYDKVKWLKDNVIPASQDAIKNKQPGTGSGAAGGQPKVIVVSPEDMN